MNISALSPVSDSPFSFFGESQPLAEKYYKIYHDGGHLVATAIEHTKRKPARHFHTVEDIDILFDSLFFEAMRLGYNNVRKARQLAEYIKNGMLLLFADYLDLDEYIERKIKRKFHNIGVRKKRFRRKAYLNRWNYFVTFTYDDKKHTSDTFRTKLRKCLSNLHTRRGWRYMGVFERAPETGRLHFHGLLYVPIGEMVESFKEESYYDTKDCRVKTARVNTFFADSFGRNDFEEITDMAVSHGGTLNYVLKYIEKQGERIVYSRGIPTEICKKVTETDIVTNFVDYVEKYVLFNDVISWERDVMHYTYKQMSMIDLICNPPRAA